MFLIKYIMLKTLYLIPLFMVLYTALIVDHDLINPTITGKYFWFYISMAMVSISAMILL